MSQDLMIKESGIIAKIELDTQISTAKAYPRKIENFVSKAIALATLDQETAESCIYCLYRKSKDGESTEIKGGSIRLAEIAATCWGNLHAASRIISNDGKIIKAEGVAWDTENNVRMSSESTRSILTRSGSTYSADMQAVAGNAACAIALRNAIFKVVPKALVDRVYAAAVKYAIGDQKTINETRKRLFAKFSKTGIEPEKILTFFGKQKMEDFDAKDLERLLGIGNAITEGVLKIDEAFALTEETAQLTANERVSQLLAGKGS
jgi:hypothetical protein